MKRTKISEKIHNREVMFHAFKRNGVQYLAFREDSNVAIFDDKFNNYGGWRSLDQFLEELRKNEGEVDPIGTMFSVTRRLYDCCAAKPLSAPEDCLSLAMNSKPCESAMVKSRVRDGVAK